MLAIENTHEREEKEIVKKSWELEAAFKRFKTKFMHVFLPSSEMHNKLIFYPRHAKRYFTWTQVEKISIAPLFESLFSAK